MTKRDPHPPGFDRRAQPAARAEIADKYQRILDAAVAVFAEKGFFVSRMSDIADRADVADGTVYLYFKNKDEILASAINTAFDGFMRTGAYGTGEAADSDQSVCGDWPTCTLKRWDRTATWRWSSRWNCGRARASLSEFSHEHLVEYFGLVRQAICDGKASGEFRATCRRRLRPTVFLGPSTRW